MLSNQIFVEIDTGLIQNLHICQVNLTQLNQQQELNAVALIEMEESCGFQKKERVCGETNQLSYYCCILLSILEGTLDDNHGTTQHHPLHSVYSPHQQTFD